jgi:DNA mismatch endonuclease (patch repair protein)
MRQPMDNLDSLRRSENMRRIRSKDTKPELVVRKLVRSLGFTGYRIHRKDIPGKPDLAWIGRKLAIFVHGCFWHGHNCKKGIRKPKSRIDYWDTKIERNRQRDHTQQAILESLGWKVLVVWECELQNNGEVAARIQRFMSM